MATNKQPGIWLISLAAIGFGLQAITESGAILFGGEAVRDAAENQLPFLLWVNFVAGLALLIGGAGLWMRRHLIVWLALSIAVATAFLLVLFGVDDDCDYCLAAVVAARYTTV